MKGIFRIYDPVLFVLALCATILGMLWIFDAGYARALMNEKGLVPNEFRSQFIFAIVAIPASMIAAAVTPDRWRRISRGFWVVCFVLLLAVEKFGREMNGAKRWLGTGSFTIQPAEFVKLAAVLYLAAVFVDRKAWPKKIPRRRDWAQWMDTVAGPKLKRAMPAIWILIAVLLIEKEPDMGTGMVVAAAAFAMFIPGGVTRKSILAAVVLAGFGAGAMVYKEPYRLDRIVNHVHRWKGENVDDIGFQTVQSELAMASGGVLGVGIGNGRAKHVLPATTTDFIMATVGEESGLLGSLATLGLVGGIVWRLFYQARRASSRYGMLVLYGVASWFGFQACVNVMMANGFLPAIGIPLPFISSGGSSLIALWLALGVCQSALAPVEEKREEETHAPGRNRWRHGRPRLSRA